MSDIYANYHHYIQQVCAVKCDDEDEAMYKAYPKQGRQCFFLPKAVLASAYMLHPPLWITLYNTVFFHNI